MTILELLKDVKSNVHIQGARTRLALSEVELGNGTATLYEVLYKKRASSSYFVVYSGFDEKEAVDSFSMNEGLMDGEITSVGSNDDMPKGKVSP